MKNDTWTDDRFCWTPDDTNTYIGNNDSPANYPFTSFEGRFKKPERKIFRNGQRLKSGEQRPDPFWLNFAVILLPVYNFFFQKEIYRRLMFGAYSRKYDKPRRKRKKKLF